MDERIRRKVKKQVSKKKGFLTHLGVYVAVGAFFFLLNLATFSGADGWWFFFPMLPWGVGLAIHYFAIFGLPGQDRMLERWEEQEMAKALSEYRDLESRSALPPGTEQELPELPRHLRKLREREKQAHYNDDDLV